MPPIETEQFGNLLWIDITRPQARNSINFDIMDAIEDLLDRLESDTAIRATVLSGGDQPIFISGGDLKEFHTIKKAKEAKIMARRMISILERFEKLPCWNIASINGATYGGGCEIMLAFDFRIASSESIFGFTQGRFYLPPGWGGLTRLVEQVGRSTALMWLAECSVIDAETALEYRLIDRITPHTDLKDKTLEWAKKLTLNDRQYIKALKEGSFRIDKFRRNAIFEELDPFSKFWEDERHHNRVENFITRKKQSPD